jgi:hypothetical protein
MTFGDDNKQLGKGWDEAEELSSQSGNWIKLESGQKILLNVVGEPIVFEKVFKEQGGEEKVQTRFSVEVFVPGQGIKTWEMSKTVFNDVKRQRGRRGADFGNALFLLERKGTGLTTKWLLDYERQLKEKELEERAIYVKPAAAAANESDVPF